MIVGQSVCMNMLLRSLKKNSLSADELAGILKLAAPSRNFLLDPQFGQARRRRRFDRSDCVYAADIVAADAARLVSLEAVRVEREILQPDELLEIEGELTFSSLP